MEGPRGNHNRIQQGASLGNGGTTTPGHYGASRSMGTVVRFHRAPIALPTEGQPQPQRGSKRRQQSIGIVQSMGAASPPRRRRRAHETRRQGQLPCRTGG